MLVNRDITTDNYTHFVNFASVGQGNDSCSWGSAPAALFKTKSDSEYSFTFHETIDEQSLGNTYIIGGPSSGKTTLISFLETNILKFRGMRIINFDRLHGMEVATRFQDGLFEDFNDDIQLNPFQMADHQINRTFLLNWLQEISGKSSDNDLDKLRMAIDMVYDLPKLDRNLSEMEPAFGISGSEGSGLYNGMKKWLPDGAFGHYFTGRKDGLSFDSRMITYDMTSLLDIPDVLGPMADYVFHRIEQTIFENPSPFFIFVDEVRAYLDTSFASKLQKSTQEYRKLDGVVAIGAQRASHLFDNEKFQDMKSNFATALLFGAPDATEDHYVDVMGLTAAEFKWVKKGGAPRQVLMKRLNSGESAILDVDLKGVGEFVGVYSSSAKEVKRLNNLRKDSSNWRTDFVNGVGRV